MRRQFVGYIDTLQEFQSTHSITECDHLRAFVCFLLSGHFNPRTPLQSATSKKRARLKFFNEFQSTHSITECDWSVLVRQVGLLNFNPRTPLQSATCELRLGPSIMLHFNPRTPLQSATQTLSLYDIDTKIFQSTHSITECDNQCYFIVYGNELHFNPRTPLQSATRFFRPVQKSLSNFNPRTPLQSATRLGYCAPRSGASFQSTHSITECDGEQLAESTDKIPISIHALHYRVRLAFSPGSRLRSRYFNPRTPLQSATPSSGDGAGFK